MENIIKVSGLGFEMEFDLKHMLNRGYKDFYNSKDLDSQFCYLAKDMATLKNARDKNKYLLTLREYNNLDEDTYRDYCVQYIPDTNSFIRCSNLGGALKLFTREELSECNINYSEEYSKITSYDIFKAKDSRYYTGGELSAEQAISIFKLMYNKYRNSLNNGILRELEDKPYWCVGYMVFLSLRKCLTIYVAKYLDVDIKKSHGQELICDKMVGRFSSTYKICLEFNGIKSTQSVVVRSNNLI